MKTFLVAYIVLVHLELFIYYEYRDIKLVSYFASKWKRLTLINPLTPPPPPHHCKANAKNISIVSKKGWRVGRAIDYLCTITLWYSAQTPRNAVDAPRQNRIWGHISTQVFRLYFEFSLISIYTPTKIYPYPNGGWHFEALKTVANLFRCFWWFNWCWSGNLIL